MSKLYSEHHRALQDRFARRAWRPALTDTTPGRRHGKGNPQEDAEPALSYHAAAHLGLPSPFGVGGAVVIVSASGSRW